MTLSLETKGSVCKCLLWLGSKLAEDNIKRAH